MTTRTMIFLVLVASGLVAERDPRLVRTAQAAPPPVPSMSEAGRATLAGFAKVAVAPTLPWNALEPAMAAAQRAREATAGAVARVESRALIDALARHNQRLDDVLSGLGVMLGELARQQKDDDREPRRVARDDAPTYPDGYELPDRQVPAAHDAE